MGFDPSQPFTVEDAPTSTRDEPSRDYFARNKAWMKPGSRNFYTDLSDDEEKKFQAWVKANKVPNDDSPQADYDMRGFWKALEAKDPKAISAIDPNDKQLHYPDYWKTPYHETFSGESKWADPAKAPKWNDRDQLVMPDGKVLFDDRAQNKPSAPSTFDPTKPFDVVTASEKDDLPWDVPYTGAQMRTAREQIRKGEEALVGSPHGILGIMQRGGQQLLGERPPPTPVEALEEASLGMRPSGFVSGARTAAGAARRIEPPPPGSGPTPTGPPDVGGMPVSQPSPWRAPTTPEPPASLSEAGLRPPQAETGTETVAVPQGDGTVTQVQVQTGQPPASPSPPAARPPVEMGGIPETVSQNPWTGSRSPEAPASLQDAGITPTPEAPADTPPPAEPQAGGPTNLTDIRAGFPDISDAQFETLFQQASREVPRPTTTDPADQSAWMKSLMGVMARLAVPATQPQQQTSGDPWAPVAIAPVGRPDGETPIAQSPGIAGKMPQVSPEITAAPVNQPEVSTETTAPAGSTAQQTPAVEAHGGPWSPVLDDDGQPTKNHLGDTVYENPNGVRAILDNGVPYTEATKETDKGLVPKNPGDRKRQHLTVDEPWEAEKPKVESQGKPGGKAGETKTETPPKAESESLPPETSKKPVETGDWKRIGENEEGDPLFTNGQGVHSVVKDGVRHVETVRMRPTRGGMEMSVPPPAEKDPAFRPVKSEEPEAKPEPKPEAVDAAPITQKPEPESGITPTTQPPRSKQVQDNITAADRIPIKEMTEFGDQNTSPFVLPNGSVISTNGDHFSVANDAEARDAGLVRINYGDTRAGVRVLGVSLPADGTSLPDEQRRTLTRLAKARPGTEVVISQHGGGDTLVASADLEQWLRDHYAAPTAKPEAPKKPPVRKTKPSETGQETADADKPADVAPEAPKSAPSVPAPGHSPEVALPLSAQPIPSSLDVAEQQVKGTNATLPGYDPKTGEMVDPDAVFADILANSIEDPNHVITASGLQAAAQGIYGGTLADGTLKRDRLYDAIELGVNTFITRHPQRFAPTGDLASAQKTAAELAALKGRIPTQTVRAGDKVKLQQFSTPPDYAFAAVWAANIHPADVVIEPSAGTGGIAVHAMNAGARVIGNEISPQRRSMMATLPFGRITAENAEQLHNILPREIKPNVVVMNPPFSSAGDRMGGKMVIETGAVHIEQALKRLAPGGRLVAIVGDGMKPEGAETAGKGGRNNATGRAFRDWWKKIGAEYDVRANIGVGGEIYRKYGTTFPTRLLVIDKVAPSGQPPVVTTALTSAELLDALQGVRDARPGSASEPVADQSGGSGVAQQGQGVSGSSEAVRPPIGDVGPGGEQDRPPAADSSKPTGTRGGKASGVRTGSGQRPGGSIRSDAPAVQQPGPDPQGVAGQSGEQPVTGDVSGGSGTGGDTSHLRPDGSDLAVTAPAPELLETSIVVPEEQTGGELTESVYENYRPQRISIEGAQPHPGPLVQSAAMASVLPPLVTYKTALPKKLITEGAVSDAQLEAIVYSGNAHAQMLEKDKDGIAKRRGFFIGDGTGVGKGREVAGIILDNKWQGRKKALWVSEKMQLANDAKRDWAGLGQNPNEILVHGKIKAGDEIKHDGILFTTYPTVASGQKFVEPKGGYKIGDRVEMFGGGTITNSRPGSGSTKGETLWTVKFDDGKVVEGTMAEINTSRPDASGGPKTRVQQIVDWVGKDFDGVIAFDEAHNMANVTGGSGTRGKKEAAAKALAGLELQNALPNARVVYVSATGATEVSNLAYADRLGLWGPGTAFADRGDFLSRVASGGVAAMELVARDMKALGYYTARSLSYDGVEYDRVQHDLTPPQRVMYDKIADAWQLVLRNMMEALKDTGADGKGGPKSAILSAFWGGHQRFFNQLITSLQMPSVIEGIDKDLAEGRQAVLQLVNTNEAGQERALLKSKERGDEDLDELDMSPRDQLLQLVDKAYPTRQYEEYLDDEGNVRVRPVSDSEGDPVHNPEAIAAKEKLLTDLGSLRVPDGPLEILVNHYGPDAVAEVTGRKQRVVERSDEAGKVKKVLEKRGTDANVAEANSFQSGKKKILIFSQAGGTGRSYHDDKTADRVDDTDRLGIGGNGARRSHYLVQAGWRADTAVQGFGRTHRTNQWTAPIFHLVTTDLEGQKRFISSIARRLGQLGALTKGERRTGDQGMFGLQDNLESDEAKAGLVQLFRDIHGGKVEGFSTDDLAKQMGLVIENDDGSLKDELPPMTQFLNRVLSLKVDDQNRVFGEFATRFRDIVDRAAEAGTLDAGTETYKADKITKARDQVVYTDPNSGAETRHVHLVTSNRNYPTSFNDLMSGQSQRAGWNAPEFFVQNKRSGYISAVTPTTFTKVDPSGIVTEHYRVSTPLDWQYVPKDDMDDSMGPEGNLTRVTNLTEARTLWDDRVVKTPEFREADLHIITGAILPIWDRLSGQPKIFRLLTDDGERLLGRVVDNKVINQTLERLGAEGVKLDIKPADVVTKILDGGVANLANGWTIKRRRVAREYRLELTGTDLYSHTAELEAAGVFRERIPGTYDTRYFIPAGETGGATIEAITKRRPIISLEGD